jgi:starvation-inducible DNA-binding protein
MKSIAHPENVAQTQLDNRMAKSRPVKMGWSTTEVETITRGLNELLANYMVHFQKLRNYHWNVKGPDFFDLHTEFEKQYEQAHRDIDAIAERVRVFGELPGSTLKEYLDISEIRETGSNLNSELMVRELLSDYRILLNHMFTVIDVARNAGDVGTEQMTKEMISRLEKNHWMLTSFLAT